MTQSKRPASSHWKRWVLPNYDAALEDQFLQILSGLAGVFSIGVIVPLNLLQSLGPWVNREIFAFGVVCLLIASAARRGHYLKKTFVVALVGILNVLWLPNAGSFGSIGLYFFTAALLIVIFFGGLSRIVSLGFLVIDILALFELERRAPRLLFHFNSDNDRFVDLFSGYVISVSMCALIAGVILAGFNRERHRAKDAMQTLEKREMALRAIFESSHDGIGIFSEGVFELVNPAFVSMFGYDRRDEFVGVPTCRMIELSRNDSSATISPTEAWSFQGSSEREGIGVRKDGTSFPLSVRLSSYDLPGGHRTVMRVIDLTERRRVEQQQQHLDVLARRKEKMDSLGALAGGIAHDMNNVLSAVLGLASVHHAEAAPSSTLRNDMEAIVRACQRGSTMVKGLLAFARDSLPEREELDLNGLVRETVATLERTSLHGVRIQLELAPRLKALRGDPVALGHAIMNVCSNAMDAMPGGGVLTITTIDVDPATVLLQIGDTGTGMSKDVLARALEPFFTTKPMGKGTGLGLPIVFGAVKAHQGKLEIHSTEGHGTEVRIRLPIHQVVIKSSHDELDTRSIPPVKVLKILLVDDDELVQHAVHRILRTMGHTVTTVSGGLSAIAVIEAGYRADLVILDMNMPEMDGAATLPRLRHLLPNVPVVLATGRVDDAALNLVASFANVTLLPKPFNAGELGKRVEAVSKSRRSA